MSDFTRDDLEQLRVIQQQFPFAKSTGDFFRSLADRIEAVLAADLPVERGIPEHGRCPNCTAWIQTAPQEPHICSGHLPVESSGLREGINPAYVDRLIEQNAELFAEISRLRADRPTKQHAKEMLSMLPPRFDRTPIVQWLRRISEGNSND